MRPQVFVFFTRQGEKKIARKTLRIAFQLFVQAFDGNTVKLSQVGVQDDFLIAQDQNLRTHSFGENDCSLVHDSPTSLRSRFVTSE